MNQLLIALFLIVWMAARQLTARPVKRNLFTVPVVALGFGLYVSYGQGVQTGEMISLLISAALGCMAGFLQGRYIRVIEQNGVWMTVGSAASIAIWLLSVPIRLAVRYGFDQTFGIHAVLTGSYAYVPFLFSIAGIMLGRALYLSFKYPEEMRAGASMSRRERRQRARQSFR